MNQRSGCRTPGGMVLRVCSGFIGLGFVGAFLMARPGCAQNRDQSWRLTVRPREMATGTRNERAGYNHESVYVPQSCVGTRRCPLLLWSNNDRSLFPFMAEKYGIITASVDPLMDPASDSSSVARLDNRIKTILQGWAIDPDKIVIYGGSATGDPTTMFAAQNLDVFSRIAVYTQQAGDPPLKAPQQTNEYYIGTGIEEDVKCFVRAQLLRDRGYPVKYFVQLRDHGNQEEDLDFLGHWLTESWAIPNPAARPKPYAFGALPRLTSRALTQLITFWERFQREPDSIQTTARRAHVREVIVPVGNQRVSTLMVDMSALAIHYPSVARALEQAGLTARQHDAYRAALLSARIYEQASNSTDVTPPPAWPDAFCRHPYPTSEATIKAAQVKAAPTSTAAQNVAFLHAHRDDLQALEQTAMWVTP